MSTCISSHGEFSEHELGSTGLAAERFVCSLCHVLDEAAALDEVDRLTQLEASRKEWGQQQYDRAKQAEAERDDLRARLAAVEALADLWESLSDRAPYLGDDVRAIRGALGGAS